MDLQKCFSSVLGRTCIYRTLNTKSGQNADCCGCAAMNMWTYTQ